MKSLQTEPDMAERDSAPPGNVTPRTVPGGDQDSARTGDCPPGHARVHRRIAEMRNLEISAELLRVQEYQPVHARQGDRRGAEFPEFLRPYIPFPLRKDVEHADRGGPLPREIVESQELEPCKAGSPERRFNVRLITEDLKLSRRLHKEGIEISQPLRFQIVPDDLIIPGAQNSRVPGDLPEIRIRTPLPCLVGDNRTVITAYGIQEIKPGRWGIPVDDARQSHPPDLYPGLVNAQIVALRDHRPARTGRVDPPPVPVLPVADEVTQKPVHVPAGRLVAVGHHTK